MTNYTVLKNFRYSLNGIHSHQAKVGVTPDPEVPDELLPGLEAEEYISFDKGYENKMLNPVTDVSLPFALEKRVPEIDNNVESETYWRKLSAPEMKLLAGQVSSETIGNKTDAVAAIELHLESLEQA